jgi:hypothetical protein
MSIEEPGFPILDNSIGVLEVSSSTTDRFHFGTTEGNSSFILFKEKIVVAGGTIYCCVPLARGKGISF